MEAIMHKRLVILGLVVFFVLTTGTLLYAHFANAVLKTDMSDPAQVVSARKGLMQAIRGNMIDINKKMKAGKIEDISADGANVAAIATVLPVFYKETYKDVYPVKGSKTYFKGARPADYEAASEKMRAPGMAIKMAAEKKDKAGVSAGLEALTGSCGGCHSAFRGKY
jgi:cytochrome c556